MESGKIERRSGLNWDSFLEEYVKPNKPVILTDASKIGQLYTSLHKKFGVKVENWGFV